VLNAKLVEKLIEANVEKIPVRAEALVGRRTATRIVDTESGEVLVGTNAELTSTVLTQVMSRRVAPFKLLVLSPGKIDASLYETLAATTSRTPTRRWSRSTASCGRAIRPPWSRPGPSSAACSSTPGATTWPGSAAS